MSFSSDLRRYAKTAGKTADKMFRGKVFGVCNAIVRRTPVDTGRLRGNWQASINSSKSGELDKTSFDITAVQQTFNDLSIGDTAYFVNNLPYSGKIENGGSKQAPTGMMKISVLEASD